MRNYIFSLNISYTKGFTIEAESEEAAKEIFEKNLEDNINDYIDDAVVKGEEYISYDIIGVYNKENE